MIVCKGCGAPSVPAVLCKACVTRVVGGLTRIQQARRRVLGRPPQPAPATSVTQRGLMLELWALQMARYLQLVPSVFLLGVHVWLWQYLFRITCVQRAALAVTTSLLMGTIVGLVVGVRQGERPTQSQLQRFMTVPEDASVANIFSRSMREQLRERLPVLLWVGLGMGVILVLFQMAMWRLSRGLSDAMVLTAFFLLQLLLSLVTALFYGSFRGMRWVPACLQYARQPVA